MTVNRKTKLFIVATLLVLALPMVLSIVPALACGDCGPGTGTPGYYKKSEHWPVLPSNPECDGEPEIDIGGKCYTEGEAIEWLNTPVEGDKSITMFKAVVAAKLNVLADNCHGCIDATIAEADLWMDPDEWACGPVGNGVEGSSSCWQYSHGERIYLMLDAYNKGELCAPSRDSLEMEGD